MATLWQDMRYAFRMLAKNPGFTAIAVLTLAVGIGANTAIFTVVYGVLLRPLPFPEPDRIVQLAETYQAQSDEMSVTAKQLERLQEYGQLFEHIAGYTDVGFNLATGNDAEHVRGVPASTEYFQVLGVHPTLGRNFLPEEDRGDGQHVAILSHSLWMRRLGGDSGVIGQKVLLNGDAYTVIGVMPAGFDPRANSDLNPGVRAEVWVPLALVAKTAGNGENISVVARLKPGVTREQLQSQMDIVTRDFRVRYPNVVGQQLVMSFRRYQAMIGAGMRPFLLVLLGAIGFVLLIACANVANLLLARGSSRGREIAVRVAMGASRVRLFRQLLTESMLIALAGGALGLAVAGSGLGSLLAMAPRNLPRLSDIHLDGWVFAFTFLISILTGAVFGIAPALHVTKTNLSETLKEGEGRASAGAGRARLRQGLVIGEFALSLVLLTGAGLMIATFAKLMNTNPGFDTHHVLTMQFWMTGSKYTSTPEIMRFYRAVEQRIETLPGVTAAGVVAAGLPLERGGNNGVRIAGPKESEWISMDYREITPGYFQAIGTPLKQGRGVTESDSEGSNPVVIVNEAVARKYFQGQSSLGKYLYVSGALCEVVGVVADVKSYLDQPAEPTTYIPAAQAKLGTSKLFEGWFPRSIVVRSTGNAGSSGSARADWRGSVHGPGARAFCGLAKLHDDGFEHFRWPRAGACKCGHLRGHLLRSVATNAGNRSAYGAGGAARGRAADDSDGRVETYRSRSGARRRSGADVDEIARRNGLRSEHEGPTHIRASESAHGGGLAGGMLRPRTEGDAGGSDHRLALRIGSKLCHRNMR